MTSDNSRYLDFTQKPDFQQILTNPILDIAARFWEDERYAAFRTCYRSMRIIDDLVDEHKANKERIPDDEKGQIALTLMQWFGSFKERKPDDEFQAELIDTVDRFVIPLWPWRRLLKAMLYDLDHDGFRSFLVFLRYTEGAAISPAAIFMHLCGVNKADGRFQAPAFDIRKASRSLAVFSYLVHIMRDFQKDSLAGLTYFADSLIESCGLKKSDLKKIAEGGEIPEGFRRMMKRYHRFAEYYRDAARQVIDNTLPQLDPPYQLSLEIIYSLYLQIYERVDTAEGRFTTDELNPTPEEVSERIYQTVTRFRPVE